MIYLQTQPNYKQQYRIMIKLNKLQLEIYLQIFLYRNIYNKKVDFIMQKKLSLKQGNRKKYKNENIIDDFKQILSNQHCKTFHLVDNPKLVFELAQYKMQNTEIEKNGNNNKKLPNSAKKMHRHKSQDENTLFDFFDQNSLKKENINQNFPFKKIKNNKHLTYLIQQEKNSKNLQIQKNKMQLLQFFRQQNNQKKEIQYDSEYSEYNNNFKEKQNIHQKILSAPRPSTSNAFLVKTLNPWNNKTGKKDQDIQNKWKKSFERKKFCQLKQRLENLIINVQQNKAFNFSQIFEYQQAILKQFLSIMVTELKKECLQKGQLVEIIWNTFFTLINKILNILTNKSQKYEKIELDKQIKLHQQYQNMHQDTLKKIKQLGKKYNESKSVIDGLVYQLRYKRKQVKKLYKSLAICNEKLNQYKVQHIDLQNEHIDLLIDASSINKDQAAQVLKRKLEINREKYFKIKVGLSKQKLKEQIDTQLQSQKLQRKEQQKIRKELIEKMSTLNQSTKKAKNSKDEKQKTNVIEQFIQKFSNKCIDVFANQDPQEISKTMRRPQKMSTAINTDFDYKPKTQTSNFTTQTTFSDKLQFSLINTRSTQTPGAQKIKKTQNVQIQVDGDHMKMILLKSKMMNYKVIDLSFYFDMKNRDQRIKPTLQKRNSSMSFKKQLRSNNYSISQLSSDQSQTQKKGNRRNSKNMVSSTKKQKKTSIFNYTLPNYSNMKSLVNSNLSGKIAQSQSNTTNNKRNSTYGSNLHKKRTSQLNEISEFGSRNNYIGPGGDKGDDAKFSRNGKRNLLQPEGSSNYMRPSISISNVDSLAQNIIMTQEKQKYIQNFIMNKNPEYQVLKENAIFQTFKQIVLSQNARKTNSKHVSRFKNSLEVQQQEDLSDQSDYELLNPKDKLNSAQKLNQIQSKQFLSISRNDKKNKSLNPTLNDKSNNPNNFKLQRQSLKQTHFLNKIIQFTVKKSLMKKKVDSSNLSACKEKSQFVSIVQKIDPFMLDVQCLLHHNFSKKKNKNLINIKSANKYIMMTYSRSIDKIYRNSAILQNLIKPLFESFEVIYGALKPQDIYRKMVSFISDLISIKLNQNFKQFIFFLGLDKQKSNSVHLTTFDVCLFLKLLEKLNLGNKTSSQIESVYTTKTKVNSELYKILQGENISIQIINIVIAKIQDLLQKLEEFVRESSSMEEQSKINLFKVSRMIVEQIMKIRIRSLNKLQYLIKGCRQKQQTKDYRQVVKIKHQMMQVDQVREIIESCRISTLKKLYFGRYIEELSRNENEGEMENKKIKRSELGILLIRIGMMDFDEMQSRFKVIQEHIEEYSVVGRWEEDCRKKNQRKIKILKKIQQQGNQILGDILGDLNILYQIGLIKMLETKGQMFN